MEATLEFYQRVVGLEAREERDGKWSLHFGSNKISIQDAEALPDLARTTVPGSGNFCVLTDLPIEDVVSKLRPNCVEIVAGPAEKSDAVGKLISIYFRDPDANLVEVSSRIPQATRSAIMIGRSKQIFSALFVQQMNPRTQHTRLEMPFVLGQSGERDTKQRGTGWHTDMRPAG